MFTFEEIYNTVIPFWGEEINISDGIILAPKNSNKKLIINVSHKNSFYSARLSAKWKEVQDKVGKENIVDLMVWSIYQYLLTEASELYLENIYNLRLTNLEKKKMEELFYKNLQEEAYETELQQYQRLI